MWPAFNSFVVLLWKKGADGSAIGERHASLGLDEEREAFFAFFACNFRNYFSY